MSIAIADLVGSLSLNLVADNNGNVGIGTKSPLEKLDVNGNGNIGGSFNVGSHLDVVGNISASGSVSGEGSGLTSLNATNISSGTLNNARLPANISVTSLTGNGSGLTSLNATNISSGTLNNARLPSAISVTSISASGSVSGEGSGLTSLNATNISSGTLNNARLPSIINTNTLIGTQVGIGTNTPLSKLSITPRDVESKITLWDGGSTTDHYGFGISPYQLNYHVSASAARHVFYSGGKNGDGTELMRIQGNGRVGIGTMNPTEALDIMGAIKLTGKIISPYFKVFSIFNKNPGGSWTTAYAGTIKANSMVVIICNTSGYRTSGGIGTWTLQYSTNGGSNYITLDTFKQYFNTISDHEEQSRVRTWNPTSDINFTHWRMLFNASYDSNDFLDLVLIVLPV